MATALGATVACVIVEHYIYIYISPYHAQVRSIIPYQSHLGVTSPSEHNTVGLLHTNTLTLFLPSEKEKIPMNVKRQA